MFIMRAVGRYWFIGPLLMIVLALQLGFGLVVTNNETPDPKVDQQNITGSAGGNQPNSAKPNLAATARPSRTPLPTLNPTSSPTPTFTPSPTRTPTKTPTSSHQPTSTSDRSPSLIPTATLTPLPQPTPLFGGSTATVPILMYHYLSAPPAEADAIRLDLSVSPEQFESHLAFLRQAGYETISFRELIFALSRQTELPPKPIIISFDDGYRDNYDNAFPLLRKYGYGATFFIFTQPIDANRVEYLSWEMVKEMHKAGMEFGSHSYSHPDLSGKDDDFQVFEVLAAKEAIEERIGEPVRFFSYPSGRYDELTIRVLKSAHFWGAVTTHWGAEHTYGDRFETHRVRVRGNDMVEDLANKLRLFD